MRKRNERRAFMNIEFKKWEMKQAKTLVALANDKEVSKYLRDVFPYPYTMNAAKSFIGFLNTLDEAKEFHRSIVVDNTIVGGCSLSLQQDVSRKSAEIGYWLGKAYWHKGIASEVVKQLCDYGFAHYDIIRIYAELFEPNIISAKVLEKNEFQLEGRLRKSIFKDDIYMDTLIYAKLHEW